MIVKVAMKAHLEAMRIFVEVGIIYSELKDENAERMVQGNLKKLARALKNPLQELFDAKGRYVGVDLVWNSVEQQPVLVHTHFFHEGVARRF
jgi:hypothetical protein